MAWTTGNNGYRPSGSLPINNNGYIPSGSLAGIGSALGSLLGFGSNVREQKFQTQVRVNGKTYTSGIDSAGNYYLSDGKSSAIIRDNNLINTIKKNEPITVNYSGSINNAEVISTPSKVESKPQQTQTQTQTKKPSTVSSGGGYKAPAAPTVDLSGIYNKFDDVFKRLNDLENPKVYTAQELADRYGLSNQFNENYWLNKYNEATNKYYDDAISEQQKLRNNYLVNNYDYTTDLVNTYLNSYRNAAPTASGQAAIAANALATQQNANYINSNNDYGMLQSINQYEEARKAELENNPWLAKQQYNAMGRELMQLGSLHNQADVTKYLGDLNYFSDYYNTYRTAQASNAQANATKYAGLAQAAATNAQTSSSASNNNLYQQLFNTASQIYGNKANTAYLNSIGYGK